MDSNDITRRRVIGTLGAAGSIALAGCGGDGEDATETATETESDGGTGETETPTQTEGTTERPEGTVKIGALQPLSGPLGFYGKMTTWGWYTAFGMKDGVSMDDLPAKDSGAGDYTFEVGNTTYELLLRDTKASPTEAQSLAGDMVRDENVDLLLGVTNSGGAQNIANNVSSQAKVPTMLGPAASASVTNSNEYCDEYVYRTAETVEMDAFAAGKYLANETDLNDIWIYYADYSFGQSINKFYTKALEEAGANILGRTALPQGYSEDWAGQFEKAQDAGADAMLGGFTVATLPQMTKTYLSNDYPFRFVGGYTTLAGAAAFGQTIDTVLEGDLTGESLQDAGMGPFTTRYHWNQYDNKFADEALQIHREKYGQNTDLYTGGAHAAISAIDQAVMQSGSTNSDDILNEWVGMEIKETLKGEGNYKFQEYNNQARSSMSVAPPIASQNPEYWPAAIQPGEPDKVYSPDQTTIKPDDVEMTCQL